MGKLIDKTVRFGLIASVAVWSLLAAAPVEGAVIAATNFDGRVLSPSNTATSLNWIVSGVADPGNMSALNASANPQQLFDNTALTQNNFTPLLNTGNGNTFWTTSLGLTVLPGFIVTVSDVVFDYVAVSAAGVLNVNRRSDFTVSLFSPSNVLLGTVDIVDAISGTTAVPETPTLTFTFPSPIDLTDPGTYTVRIQGGDYLGFDETGNHTGIDNLSINGTVVVPEPSVMGFLGMGAVFVVLRRRRRR